MRRDETIARALALVAAAGLALSLFLPWYSGDTGIRCVRAPCPSFVDLTGWEAFRVADLLLIACALLAASLAVAGRFLRSRLADLGVALVGWSAVALIAFSYFRPAGLATVPGGGDPASGLPPPSLGALLGLLAAGALSVLGCFGAALQRDEARNGAGRRRTLAALAVFALGAALAIVAAAIAIDAASRPPEVIPQ